MNSNNTVVQQSAWVGVLHAIQALETLIHELPNSREQSLAITKLDECYMWAERAVDVSPMPDSE